jgi:hypothetical protein
MLIYDVRKRLLAKIAGATFAEFLRAVALALTERVSVAKPSGSRNCDGRPSWWQNFRGMYLDLRWM